MQKPHCAAPVSRNAACSALRPPSPASPSTVVTSQPSASAASTRHASTLRPPTSTVHAPHSPTRQHSLVPVSPRSSRRASSSVWCPATSTARGRPLSVRRIATRRSRGTAGGQAAGRLADRAPRRGRGASPAGSRGSRASRWATARRPRGAGRGRPPGRLRSRRDRRAPRCRPRPAAAAGRRCRRRAASPRPARPSRPGHRGQVVAAAPRPAEVRGAARLGRAPGSSIAVTSSPRARVVTPERTHSSSTGMRRSPRRPATTSDRAVDEQGGRRVRGGRGVAQVAGQRRAVPDLDRAHDQRPPPRAPGSGGGPAGRRRCRSSRPAPR